MKMREIMQIVEGRRDTFMVRGKSVRTMMNPSKAEFRSLLKRSQYGILRGLLSGGDLMVWDAALATHEEPEFGGGIALAMKSETVFAYPSGDQAANTIRFAKIAEHPRIIQAYGQSPAVSDYEASR
jgi:hypothetical protein